MQKESKEFRVEVNQKFDEVNKRFDNIEAKLESTHNQTADLTEFRTEINTKLDKILKEVTEVEEVTKVNCYDIAKLKACR
ncbi:hypothetical protein KPL39_06875 [Clostridium gasigenes]|nr:hypothetical protein [Clostridium gasigenes]